MINRQRSAAESGFGLNSHHNVRVLIADDECMFRVSLRQLLTAPPSVIKDVYGVDVGAGFQVVGEAGSGEETVAAVRSANPDLLILDLSMPRMSGLGALRELQADKRPVRTIVLSGAIERSNLLDAVQLGVHGIVLKDSTTELLFQAIMCVVAGKYWLGQSLVSELMETVRTLPPQSTNPSLSQYGLTRREREVLALVVAGCPNKEIARTCAISEETVKHHLTRMFDKVGATNRIELAMMATERGLVAEP